MDQSIEAVVAGHICLDVIPGLGHIPSGKLSEYLQPGHTMLVGQAGFCTGGPVSNTGLALHRLGVHTRLIAKVGQDPFGEIVLGLAGGMDAGLASGLVVDPKSPTSYTVVLSAPGSDRIFLHCVGANDDFGSEDIDYKLVFQARLFHFGYPTVMRRMYSNGGAEMTRIFRMAKETGVTTSLDLTFPDPDSPGGKADWVAIFRACLPYVDIFLPSFEELLFCLRKQQFDELTRRTNNSLLDAATPELVSDLGAEILSLGAKIAVIKLGDRGLYLRTSNGDSLSALGRAAPLNPAAWADLELRSTCFKVDVVGTTGSGDTTIAGFLAALLRGLSPQDAVTAAVAVGACNVEAADALSGLRSWDETMARIRCGWSHHDLVCQARGWEKISDGLWQKSTNT